ncbi:hypothetical protein GCM10028802_05120 [Terrabacter terrigena]
MHGHGLGDREDGRDESHRVGDRTDGHPPRGLGEAAPRDGSRGIETVGAGADAPLELAVAPRPDAGRRVVRVEMGAHDLVVDAGALLGLEVVRAPDDDLGETLVEGADGQGLQSAGEVSDESHSRAGEAGPVVG